jgi:RNA polymerase sigma-70 factor, ECF subfamily
MRNDKPLQFSDDDLLSRAVKGDKNAFGMLYERYLTPIYRYCFFRVANPLEAEDLTEQTFLKAWESLRSPRNHKPIRSFRAWVYRIAHNTVIDHHRTSKPSEPIEHQGVGADTKPNPEIAVQTRETGNSLARAISGLEPTYQQVIVCRFVNQLSHAETAETLGLSENHIRILQFRALKKLAAILRKEKS